MVKFIYKRKFYNNPVIRKFIRLSVRGAHVFDGLKDRRICGCSLVRYVPSAYRETMGATGSYPSSYWALDKVFKGETFSPEDRFVDVGCGKGRVLAYLIGRKAPCSLTGIELNEEVASFADSWAKKYPAINIIHGNAFEQDYNDYTVLFLARPFEEKTFYRFVDFLEENLTHRVKFFYWWDTESGGCLENRPGWTMLRRQTVFASHGLFMFNCPQRFTVWEYVPQK